MSIYIPDAAQDAARDACDAWWADTERNDVTDLPFVALEAALPHLLPVITADLRAQVEIEIRKDERERVKEALEKYAAQDGVLYVLMYHGFGQEHPHAWTPWLDDAFDALAGTEGE